MPPRAKQCPKCLETKPETEFYLQARGYPWRMAKCKKCHCKQSLEALRRRRPAQRIKLKA